MQATRRIIATAVLAALAVSGASIQANAHPGHGPAIITIDRPAAGTFYVNDVAQAGTVDQVGGIKNPAVSKGDKLTITVSWKCPPKSTTARVEIVATDSGGAPVWSSGLFFGPPAGSWSVGWPSPAAGTYTLTATVKCTHSEQDPRGGTTIVVDGTDTDTRTVIIL